MTPQAPARIFAIRARDGKTATVFRRGPSKLTQLLSWDLKTDRITEGQWLKAAVYPRRCDLSPDGQHLIYFAATHKGGDASNWTAISRPPYWTALHFYGQNHAWNGGGVFLDNRRFWPDLGFGSSTAKKVGSGLVRDQKPPGWLKAMQGEDLIIYLPRLQRDGWVLDAKKRKGFWPFQQTDAVTLTREVRPKWLLKKVVTVSLKHRGPYGEVYWETHWLCGPNGEQPMDDEWAEVDGHSILYAAKGRLFRQRVHRTGPDEPVRIANLTPNRFSNIRAPYEGLRRTIK